MRSKSGLQSLAEGHVSEIRRATRKKHNAEEKIRIVLEGLPRKLGGRPTGARHTTNCSFAAEIEN
jgi:hypothetical protein